MIKHKPKDKSNVEIDGVLYKLNGLGIVELPDVYEQFNPIEEPKKKRSREKEE